MKKDVLMIFKTHLDIGFTDYAKNIVQKYMDEYIPNAIKVGNALKGTKTPFIWTVGSWLVWEALKHDKDGSVEQAIKDGILSWHSMPFTTHTEVMNTELFEYGMDIAVKLDERFGTKTISAKMTDVPGHTLGMIPLMQKRGVEFLHLGVNPATPLPPVPPLFTWKNGDSQITVMYQGDYGEVVEFDDFVIYFAHTHDNFGPQSEKEIIDIYYEVQLEFPGYHLRAATLNEVTERMRNVKNLPVLEKEIGDTWIHGVGTDPQKTSRYRKLLRHIAEHKTDVDLTDHLLLVPEHTWGMDLKTFFHNDTDYTHIEMDKVDAAEKKVIEDSWQEQRDYVIEAEKALGVTPDYPIAKPDFSQYEEISCDKFPEIEISWQLFDNSDYERYKTDYMRLTDEIAGWALWDFTKMGLPDYQGGVFAAKPVSAYKNGEEIVYLYRFDAELTEEYGLPYFTVVSDGEKLEIKWFDKKASRLPQAFWLKMNGLSENWEVHKLGTWIGADDIVGSPLITAVDFGVRNTEVEIESVDVPLVAPYGRRLLQYNCKDVKQDLYFNLYNNIFNSNFPMWYSDDAMFRFCIKPNHR